MTHEAAPLVPVSWGELLDKVTILEIKRERITRNDERAAIKRRINDLVGSALVEEKSYAGGPLKTVSAR